MLSINILGVTQAQARMVRELPEMIEFVKNGGVYSEQALVSYAKRTGEPMSSLIQVNRFEDGRYFVSDGHHRCISILEGGRSFLADGEYELLHRQYKDWAQIVFDLGWVTPFDPRIQVRLPELSGFKKRVLQLRRHNEADARHLVMTRPGLYCIYRDQLPGPADTVDQLRHIWRKQYQSLVC